MLIVYLHSMNQIYGFQDQEVLLFAVDVPKWCYLSSVELKHRREVTVLIPCYGQGLLVMYLTARQGPEWKLLFKVAVLSDVH